MNNNFWLNAYSQLHNFWTTIGIAIALALAEYLVDNSDSGWTWKAALIAGLGAFIKWAVTHDDHKKTKKAVQAAVIETQEVLEKKGEI